MAEYKPMSEEESLRRSHSGFSNFKLTLVCLLCAIALPVFVASLGTVGTGLIPTPAAVIAAVVSGAAAALSLFLISRFKR